MDGWRYHSSHREETKAVKLALDKAGIRYRKVTHGTGTAWAWLNIYLGDIPRSVFMSLRSRILQVVKDVTGRHGEYDGEILVLNQ